MSRFQAWGLILWALVVGTLIGGQLEQRRTPMIPPQRNDLAEPLFVTLFGVGPYPADSIIVWVASESAAHPRRRAVLPNQSSTGYAELRP